MSLCRDMMPAWELRAALDASEAECTALRAEIERLRAALQEIVDLGGAYGTASYAERADKITRAAMGGGDD